MRNITVSLDERLIERSRRYAAAHQTTLNQLVRDLLEKTVREDPGADLEALFAWADASGLKSSDGPLSRSEAHER